MSAESRHASTVSHPVRGATEAQEANRGATAHLRIPTEMYLKMQFGLGPNRLRQTVQRALKCLKCLPDF